MHTKVNTILLWLRERTFTPDIELLTTSLCFIRLTNSRSCSTQWSTCTSEPMGEQLLVWLLLSFIDWTWFPRRFPKLSIEISAAVFFRTNVTRATTPEDTVTDDAYRSLPIPLLLCSYRFIHSYDNTQICRGTRGKRKLSEYCQAASDSESTLNVKTYKVLLMSTETLTTLLALSYLFL